MRSADSFEKIFIYPKPIDMRKQINGLAHIVESCSLEIFSPSLFVFTNKQKRLIKTIYWAQTGFCLWMIDRKSTRLNSSHSQQSRMPSSA